LSAPVLVAPNFKRQFKLFVDTSDIGAGVVLKKEDEHIIVLVISQKAPKEIRHN